MTTLVIALLSLYVSIANAQPMKHEKSSSVSATSLGGTVTCANGSSINLDSGTLYIGCTSNKIGIGNTSPLFELDVVGDQRISSNLIVVDTATVQGNAFSVGVSTLVATGGRVGIGTASPGAKLEVNAGSNNLTENVALIKGGGSSGAFGFEVQANNGDSYFKTNNLTGDITMNTVGGNTGIGTATPDARLVVSTGTTNVMPLKVSNEADGVTLNIGSDAAGFPGIQGRLISNNNTFDISINAAGGSVGIGVSDPTDKLHVITASGNNVVSSSSTASGFGVFHAHGTSGGCLMIRDTDDAGWTECKALNGTLSCATDADGVCD